MSLRRPRRRRATEQPGGPAGATVFARPTRAAVAAAAEQPPAGRAGLPGARSPGGAVGEQRAPGQRQGALVDCVEHLLLQVLQERRACGNVVAVETQQSARTACAGCTQRGAGPGVAAVAAVADQHSIAAGPAVTTDAI